MESASNGKALNEHLSVSFLLLAGRIHHSGKRLDLLHAGISRGNLCSCLKLSLMDCRSACVISYIRARRQLIQSIPTPFYKTLELASRQGGSKMDRVRTPYSFALHKRAELSAMLGGGGQLLWRHIVILYIQICHPPSGGSGVLVRTQ
jgi:hypothetical protein